MKHSDESINTDPPILRTKIVALEHVFEYLKLSDICSIGETCKTLQQIAGYYFKVKYPGEKFIISRAYHDVDISQKLDNSSTNFAPFAQRIKFLVQARFDDRYRSYVTKNVSENVKSITFCTVLCDLNLTEFKDILRNVECLDFRSILNCTLHPETLTFCQHLKCLSLNVDELKYFYNCHCPTLEALKIDFKLERSKKSYDLITFLRRNLQIRRFKMKNADINFMLFIIAEAKPNLDELSIDKLNDQESVHIGDRLNHFHELGYFERLSYCGNHASFLNDIANVPTLTRLYINYHDAHNGRRKSNICEIGRRLSESVKVVDFTILYIQPFEADCLSMCLTNIVRIKLIGGTFELLSLFARRLPALKMAVSKDDKRKFDDIISLKKINDERTKLLNARKLIMYVGEERAFQHLRWKFIDLNLSLVEIRPYSQYRQHVS